MTVEKQLIDKVESIRTTLHEISVYNLDVKTSLELYYDLAKKVNEVINELSRFEGVVSDEVIKQNEKLIYLLGEGLKEQVGLKIDELITNGTMDSIINHKIFNDLNTKIDTFKQEIDEQFNTIVNKVTTRIFKPRFGVSTYWGEVTNTTGGCYTATFENMKNDVEIWKAHGVDDVVVILHVGYNTLTNDLFLAEDLELIKQGCNSIIENGLNIKTVKLHVMELTKENATTMGIELFKSKYKSLINNICNKFAPLHIEYFIPFNEVDWIYNDDSYKQFVIDVVNLCKTFSYKTSISTAGHEENFNISDDITSLLDAISINYYQSISSKNNISYNDSINSWKTSPLLNFCEHFKTKYPSKHIFISETGVNDYKEALINPETSFGLDRNNGIYQSIYMIGMFNVLNSQFIDGIWWWFGFSNKDGLTSKITNYYLRGGNYEL